MPGLEAKCCPHSRPDSLAEKDQDEVGSFEYRERHLMILCPAQCSVQESLVGVQPCALPGTALTHSGSFNNLLFYFCWSFSVSESDSTFLHANIFNCMSAKIR